MKAARAMQAVGLVAGLVVLTAGIMLMLEGRSAEQPSKTRVERPVIAPRGPEMPSRPGLQPRYELMRPLPPPSIRPDCPPLDRPTTPPERHLDLRVRRGFTLPELMPCGGLR